MTRHLLPGTVGNFRGVFRTFGKFWELLGTFRDVLETIRDFHRLNVICDEQLPTASELSQTLVTDARRGRAPRGGTARGTRCWAATGASCWCTAGRGLHSSTFQLKPKPFWSPTRVPLSNRLGENHAPNVSHKLLLILSRKVNECKPLARGSALLRRRAHRV